MAGKLASSALASGSLLQAGSLGAAALGTITEYFRSGSQSSSASFQPVAQEESKQEEVFNPHQLFRLSGRTGRLEPVPQEEHSFVGRKPRSYGAITSQQQFMQQQTPEQEIALRPDQQVQRQEQAPVIAGDMPDVANISDSLSDESMNDSEMQELFQEFGVPQENQEFDVRDLDPQRAQMISEQIRARFPSADPQTVRRLTKAVMVLAVGFQIPWGGIKDFISQIVVPVWEWSVDRQKDQNGDPLWLLSDQKALPPQCRKHIYMEHGRLVTVMVCEDENGRRIYKQQ